MPFDIGQHKDLTDRVGKSPLARNNQTRFAATGLNRHKQNMTFLEDELIACEGTLNAVLSVEMTGSEDVADWMIDSAGSWWNGSANPIDATTPGTDALLTYHFYIGDDRLYSGQVAPNSAAHTIGNWTVTAGTRSVAQFETEIVDNIRGTSYTGNRFQFEKMAWGIATGFIDNGYHGCESVNLDVRLTVTAVASTETINSVFDARYHRMDVQYKVEALESCVFAEIYQVGNDFEVLFNGSRHDNISRVYYDVNRGQYVTRPISGTPDVVGRNPRSGLTVNGTQAQYPNFTGSIRKIKGAPLVNGFPQFLNFAGAAGSTIDVHTITKNTTDGSCDERKDWEITHTPTFVLSKTGDNLHAIIQDPSRTMNGQPIYHSCGPYGGKSWNIHYWDGAAWQYVAIYTIGTVGSQYMGRYISVDDGGNIVIGGQKTASANVIEFSVFKVSGDYLVPGNWTEHVVDTVNFGSWAKLQHPTIIGYDAINNFPILAYIDYSGTIYRYEHNGGSSATSADWDKSTIFQIPELDGQNFLSYMGINYDPDIGQGLAFNVHSIFRFGLDGTYQKMAGTVDTGVSYRSSTWI